MRQRGQSAWETETISQHFGQTFCRRNSAGLAPAAPSFLDSGFFGSCFGSSWRSGIGDRRGRFAGGRHARHRARKPQDFEQIVFRDRFRFRFGNVNAGLAVRAESRFPRKFALHLQLMPVRTDDLDRHTAPRPGRPARRARYRRCGPPQCSMLRAGKNGPFSRRRPPISPAQSMTQKSNHTARGQKWAVGVPASAGTIPKTSA